MRQRIRLTAQMRAYLQLALALDPAQLDIHYWYRLVLQDPATAPRILHAPPDRIQQITHRIAHRRQQAWLRQLLGLPRPSGSILRQQRYRRALTQIIRNSRKCPF
jgi:hypothetical protein